MAVLRLLAERQRSAGGEASLFEQRGGDTRRPWGGRLGVFLLQGRHLAGLEPGTLEPTECGRRYPRRPTSTPRPSPAATSSPPPRAAGHGATAQRAAEPAWHRRQRRQRASARVLLRVASAARTLKLHHSAQREAAAGLSDMPAAAAQRDDVAALASRFDDLERLVRGLHGGGGRGKGEAQRHGKGGGREGAYAGGGKGGGQAASGASKGGGRGGGVRGRPGDWRCPSCDAYPCFARAQTCFACGAARCSGGGGSAGGERGGARRPVTRPAAAEDYLGPVGAGGARPLLGRRGVDAAGCPTARVPGASAAARVEEGRTRHLEGKGGGDEPRRRQETDADGFVRVRGGPPCVALRAPTADAPAAKKARNSWAELSEDAMDEDDAVPMQNAGNEDHDGGADGGCGRAADAVEEVDGDDGDQQQHRQEQAQGVEGDAQELSEEDLRNAWQKCCCVCRLLERDPNAADMPSLLAEARARRDEAERKWRATKRPHPLHKRMRWAEAELREAESKERLHQQELDAHLEQAARKTRELQERQRVDAARTGRKRAALAELHREALPAPCTAADSAVRTAATGICTDVLPPLRAAIEQLASPPGDDVAALRQHLEVIAESASRVEEVLRDAAAQAPGGGGTVFFDIGESQRAGGGGRASAAAEASAAGTRGADGDGSGAKDGAGEPRGAPAAAMVPRWSQRAANMPWTRSASSMAAAEAARRIIGEGGGVGAASMGEAAEPATRNAVARKGDDEASTGATVLPSAADTNDLAEAERRARRAAEHQVHLVHQRQQQQPSAEMEQQQEQERLRRLQMQQEELQRHQAAAEEAAARRRAEDEQRKQELIASMSSDELARAAAVHAQQAAIGAVAFGTAAASQLAGLVHQEEVRRVAQDEGGGNGNEAAVVDRLMAMSPEELAEHEWGRQQDGYW